MDHTYLLRLRPRTVTTDESNTPMRLNADHTAQWQLILIHPYTGAHRAFDTLEAFTTFLQEQMDGG